MILTIEERVAAKVAAGLTASAAAAAVEAEGQAAWERLLAQLKALSEPPPPAPRRSCAPKGKRVTVPGYPQQFSFGPVWLQQVRAGKGLKADEVKVRAHAAHLGHPNHATAELAELIGWLQARLG
jgi:hypothetical protein